MNNYSNITDTTNMQADFMDPISILDEPNMNMNNDTRATNNKGFEFNDDCDDEADNREDCNPTTDYLEVSVFAGTSLFIMYSNSN